MGSTMVGVALALLASCMNATGLNLQKLGQKQGAAAWLNASGIALAAVSGIVDLVSFGFAPQSLLAPLGAATLIANLAMAPVFHAEKLSQVDIMATALVCTGIMITLASSPSSSPNYTYKDIKQLAFRPAFIGFIVMYGSVAAVLLTQIMNRLQQEERAKKKDKQLPEPSLFDMAAFPMLSAMIGGITVLSAKLMTELFKVVSLKSHWYVLGPVIAMLATCAVCQTVVLNRGVGKYSSLFVVPVFSASFLLCNLSAGGVFFNEFSRFTAPQLSGFLLGVAVVVSGVSTLAVKRSTPQKNERKQSDASPTSSRRKED